MEAALPLFSSSGAFDVVDGKRVVETGSPTLKEAALAAEWGGVVTGSGSNNHSESDWSTGDALALVPTLGLFDQPPSDSATPNFPPLNSSLSM
uniref:Transposase, IS605 OrfB family, central region n=1 Tax=uncultured haloarchaeon TaxID=160804 RepID=A0A0K1YB52_9EURY|nr:transposase, IS605 OrfB family, central region [uncultured haloarchaeon]